MAGSSVGSGQLPQARDVYIAFSREGSEGFVQLWRPGGKSHVSPRTGCTHTSGTIASCRRAARHVGQRSGLWRIEMPTMHSIASFEAKGKQGLSMAELGGEALFSPMQDFESLE